MRWRSGVPRASRETDRGNVLADGVMCTLARKMSGQVEHILHSVFGYRAFRGPQQQIIERAHRAGAFCHVHCHGNIRETLEMIIGRGADYTEPVEPPPDGDITFAEAKELAAGRITLGGNIEARILERESADAVEAATRVAFEGGKQRMVLSISAPPVGKMSALAVHNYHRMIDVWEELSPI